VLGKTGSLIKHPWWPPANIPEEAKSEVVVPLLEIIKQQAELIQELRDEIARLKGHNPKPKISPSRLDEPEKHKPKSCDKNLPESEKRHKTAELVIHDERKTAAEPVPEGSRFRGYKDVIVQDLHIEAHNIRFRLECWQALDGRQVTAAVAMASTVGSRGRRPWTRRGLGISSKNSGKDRICVAV
jgi:hypothetical protein